MSRGRREMESLEQQISDHIEAETQNNIARGMAPADAACAARRKFGNVLQTREDARAVWLPPWIDHFLQDARFAFRSLHRNPGFALAVATTLALGIGMNTAIFSTVNAVLLRPLSYPEPERLVAYSDGVSGSKAEHFKPGVEAADFAEWRGQAKKLEGMAGYQYNDVTLVIPTEANQVRVASVAGDLWKLAGARPAFGRLFAPEDRPGVIVISHRLFERFFGRDPSVIGSTVTLGGAPTTIIGVLPPDFRFLFPQDAPHLASHSSQVEAYIPAPPPVRGSPDRKRMVFVVGKLRPNVHLNDALVELRSIQTSVQHEHPDRWFVGVPRMRLLPLKERLVGNFERALVILQGAGVLVLAIACVNIANLLLARAAARQKEIAIRAAIGAGGGRVFRQFMAEGLILAIIGGVAGLFLASGGTAVMARLASQAVPQLAEVSIDRSVLLFTLLTTIASGILFGLVPAVPLWKSTLHYALKAGTRGGSDAPTGVRTRSVLVATELALAVVLLISASLMLKSFWRMYDTPPGFAPAQTLLMNISAISSQPPAEELRDHYIPELIRRLESVPGVRHASIAKSETLLLQSRNPSVQPVVDQFQDSLVSPGYFKAIGMRLIRGRWISTTDPPDATIINETMARRVFGTDDPIGRRIEKLGRPVSVVGVVANLKYAKLDVEPGPEIYRSHPSHSSAILADGILTLVVRASANPRHIARAIRKLAASIDPARPVYNIRTLQEVLTASIAPRRFNLFILATFAATALLLAIIGIYGVIAYSVTQRTREIGVRMAMGAQRSAVIRLVVGQGMLLAVSGAAIGLLGALGFTRALASLLYEVEPNDGLTFLVVPICLILAALAACWGPALGASRVHPLAALRYE
jgi:predicted permease